MRQQAKEIGMPELDIEDARRFLREQLLAAAAATVASPDGPLVERDELGNPGVMAIGTSDGYTYSIKVTVGDPERTRDAEGHVAEAVRVLRSMGWTVRDPTDDRTVWLTQATLTVAQDLEHGLLVQMFNDERVLTFVGETPIFRLSEHRYEIEEARRSLQNYAQVAATHSIGGEDEDFVSPQVLRDDHPVDPQVLRDGVLRYEVSITDPSGPPDAQRVLTDVSAYLADYWWTASPVSEVDGALRVTLTTHDDALDTDSVLELVIRPGDDTLYVNGRMPLGEGP
jgi:hypothetical protein